MATQGTTSSPVIRVLSPDQQTEVAARFEQYKPMALSFARTFHVQHGSPLFELQDFALSALGTILAERYFSPEVGFDPSRSCLNTWVYRRLYFDCLHYSTRKWGKAKVFADLVKGDERPVDQTQKASWIEKLLSNLGEDAKVLVQTILFAPAEIVEDIQTTTKARARSAVRAHLKEQGWPPERIEDAWSEVTQAL